MNKANLRKLAKFLDTVSVDAFDMSDFMLNDEGYDVKVQQHKCGTVACAIGYGPAAGLAVSDFDFDWFEYSERVTGIDMNSPAWDWCFSPTWCCVDNTPQGAAKRIRYLLKHGSPPEGYSINRDEDFVSVYQ